MVLLDTSLWIDYFRAKDRSCVERVHQLLDRDEVVLAAPVRIEILSGASQNWQQALDQVLSALPIFYPSEETWERMEAWIPEGLSRGERFGAMDLLIAAIAAEQKVFIWSRDSDFRRMQRLGWVSLFELV